MAKRSATRELDALRAAFGLLTLLPQGEFQIRKGTLGRAVGYFPFVGLVLGGLGGVLAVWMGGTFSPWLAATALTGLMALVTGGLHLDGLADTADGMGGGRGDRARILEIMRDSRVGSFGVVALVILLLGKIAGLAALMGSGGSSAHLFWGIALMPVCGRWGGVLLIRFFGYARTEGLGRVFCDESGGRELAMATGTVVIAILIAGEGGWVPLLAAAGGALILGYWANARIGGLTGDVYGAAIELSEVIFLWGFATLR